MPEFTAFIKVKQKHPERIRGVFVVCYISIMTGRIIGLRPVFLKRS